MSGLAPVRESGQNLASFQATSRLHVSILQGAQSVHAPLTWNSLQIAHNCRCTLDETSFLRAERWGGSGEILAALAALPK